MPGPALPIIALAGTVIGGITSAGGAILGGMNASSQAAYQAGVARNNEAMAKAAARDALLRGGIEAKNKADQTRQLIGRERATLAGNGVDVNSGSALDIVSDTETAGATDELTIRDNARRQSIGYLNQGENFAGEAALDDTAQSNALLGGYANAFGTALTTGGNVASKWYAYKDQGIFGGGSDPAAPVAFGAH